MKLYGGSSKDESTVVQRRLCTDLVNVSYLSALFTFLSRLLAGSEAIRERAILFPKYAALFMIVLVLVC